MMKLPFFKRNIFPSIAYGAVISAAFFTFHYALVAIEDRSVSDAQQESSLVINHDSQVAESEPSNSTSFPASEEKPEAGANKQKSLPNVSSSEKKEKKSDGSNKKPKKKYGALVTKARDLRQDVNKSKKKKKVFLQDEVVDLSDDWVSCQVNLVCL